MVDIQSPTVENRQGKKEKDRTRMWANAQRDSRPALVGNGAQMAIFGDFLASCIFSELHAARFRPAS